MTPTPHIEAKYGDFAETVLMPGDPLRAKFIAENFLEDARLVNGVRGINGYTGRSRGIPVSVMASGMGMPSIGIYSHELYSCYGVKNILRVGTAGGMSEAVKVRDMILGIGASTDSSFAAQFRLPGTYSATADFSLLREAVQEAEERGYTYHVGGILSSDAFYNADPDATARWREMGILAVEMEAAALYMNAARLGGRALAICTVSDHLLTGEATTAQERQTTFTDMMELALAVARRMAEKSAR
jgi:purine-nucleoside phosphorylase